MLARISAFNINSFTQSFFFFLVFSSHQLFQSFAKKKLLRPFLWIQYEIVLCRIHLINRNIYQIKTDGIDLNCKKNQAMGCCCSSGNRQSVQPTKNEIYFQQIPTRKWTWHILFFSWTIKYSFLFLFGSFCETKSGADSISNFGVIDKTFHNFF